MDKNGYLIHIEQTRLEVHYIRKQRKIVNFIKQALNIVFTPKSYNIDLKGMKYYEYRNN